MEVVFKPCPMSVSSIVSDYCQKVWAASSLKCGAAVIHFSRADNDATTLELNFIMVFWIISRAWGLNFRWRNVFKWDPILSLLVNRYLTQPRPRPSHESICHFGWGSLLRGLHVNDSSEVSKSNYSCTL